jgi:hypothetical protein
MRATRTIGWALAAWMLAASSPCCQALPAGTGLETGGDLSVRVAVEPLSPEARGIGLDRDALQLRVEQRLRGEGLIVLDDAAWCRRPDVPRLSVRVDVTSDAIGGRYGGEVRLERQVASVGGSASSRTMAVVWWRAIAGGSIQQLTIVATEFFNWRWRSHQPGSRTGHVAYINDAVLAAVDAFAAEFLAANRR